MTEQNQQQTQTNQPTALQTAVEFSMAWLSTQGDIGKMVQRTLMTALQDNDQLQQVLQGQTQEIARARMDHETLVALSKKPEWLREQIAAIEAEPMPYSHRHGTVEQ